VVVEEPDDAADRYIADCAWDAGFANDVVMSTVTYSRQEFEEGPCSASPLVQAILHEGLAVSRPKPERSELRACNNKRAAGGLGSCRAAGMCENSAQRELRPPFHLVYGSFCYRL